METEPTREPIAHLVEQTPPQRIEQARRGVKSMVRPIEQTQRGLIHRTQPENFSSDHIGRRIATSPRKAEQTEATELYDEAAILAYLDMVFGERPVPVPRRKRPPVPVPRRKKPVEEEPFFEWLNRMLA